MAITQNYPVNTLAVSEGDVAFGFSMLPYLGKGNISFSPLSIRTALSMIYEGARKASAKEISDTAFIPKVIQTRLKGYNDLMSLLNSKDDNHTLSSANSLWINRNFNVNPSYQTFLREIYKIDFTNDDFISGAGLLRTDKTEGKIPQLFPPGSITPNTVIALANTLYFKGIWENKFDIKLTQKYDYTLEDGKKVQVDMMTKGEIEGQVKLPKLLYGSFDGFQIIMLPYKGHELANIIMLAPRTSDISQLEEAIQKVPRTFADLLEKLEWRSFSRLEIPKHEVHGSYSLNSPLQKMGIKSIFDPKTSDLKGIGDGELFIDSLHHQTYFKTDEEGSEGSAVTGFSARRATSCEKPKTVEFVVDRPFLEMIIHKPTKSLLFLNRIADPR